MPLLVKQMGFGEVSPFPVCPLSLAQFQRLSQTKTTDCTYSWCSSILCGKIVFTLVSKQCWLALFCHKHQYFVPISLISEDGCRKEKFQRQFICIRLTEIPFGLNILFHQKDRKRYVRDLPRFPHNVSLEQMTQNILLICKVNK